MNAKNFCRAMRLIRETVKPEKQALVLAILFPKLRQIIKGA